MYNGRLLSSKMAASIAEEIAKLANPAPKSIDPEDDIYSETAAKVTERFKENYDDDDAEPVQPHHRPPVFLSSLDTKYAGKATSRSALQDDWGQDSSDDEDLDPGLLTSAFIEGTEESDDDTDVDNSPQHDTKQTSQIALKPGIESLSFQEDSDEDMYGSDDNDEDDNSEEDADDTSDGEEETVESHDEEQDTKDELAMEAFSTHDKAQDLAKAAATKCQLGLWDSLLESRIKLQKALPLTNQLPQSDSRSEFIQSGGDPFTSATQAGAESLRGLLDTLLELQQELLNQNPETHGYATNGETENVSGDEDITEGSDSGVEERKLSKKRPHEDTDDYPEQLHKRHKLTQKFNLSTIEKWSEKTKLSSGKYNSKAFSSFNKSVGEQIEQILGDQERLVKRTQLRRSTYRVLGRGADRMGEQERLVKRTQLRRSTYKVLGRGADKIGEQDFPSKLDTHLKEYDEEIFDDDDFYHQLLRELIERKTTTDDPTELTKQWLEVQKLRKKVRKKVDTRASKGRKIRYDIHQKLANFMAPIHRMAMSEEACNELFSSLFGKKEKTSSAER